MSISVCPAAVVQAPPEKVWGLLGEPARLQGWAAARLLRADPPGPVSAGQTILMRARSVGWRRRLLRPLDFDISFRILRVDPDRRWLEVDVEFPLGIVNHERITLDPVEAGTLVRFN